MYKIHGNWNSKIYVGPCDEKGKITGDEELVFEKNEYPEKWAYMYGQ